MRGVGVYIHFNFINLMVIVLDCAPSVALGEKKKIFTTRKTSLRNEAFEESDLLVLAAKCAMTFRETGLPSSWWRGNLRSGCARLLLGCAWWCSLGVSSPSQG